MTKATARYIYVILLLYFSCAAHADRLLIPMDGTQSEHCRAYGLVYQALARNESGIAWILNYRGGSFVLPHRADWENLARQLGVSIAPVTDAEFDQILALGEHENIDVVPLTKAPRIALYLPDIGEGRQDVVFQTLAYAGIPSTLLYDAEILDGRLKDFDWLHVHHKDFTGQGHKRGHDHYDRELAAKLSFNRVWRMKQAVADRIRDFVGTGGFLFAMCSAAETLDIALAAKDIDIVAENIDGDPPDPDANRKLDFTRALAFSGFAVSPRSGSEYSNIDETGAGRRTRFSLFEFSAQVDPIPSLLNQNHVTDLPGFEGETTSFCKDLVKKTVTILAENSNGNSVRYLTGTHGSGVFSYYGGHMPARCDAEGFRQAAPGFRLILNNVLFPAAKTKKRKT